MSDAVRMRETGTRPLGGQNERGKEDEPSKSQTI